MPEYLTARYQTAEAERVLELVTSFPFATLLAEDGDDVAYAPVVVERAGDELALLAHLDNENPFLARLDGTRLRALFHGPNGYISPLDYASRQFPTWNYAVAELSGTVALIQDAGEKRTLMQRTVEVLEGANGSGWRLERDDPRVAPLLERITFLRLPVDALRGTFKFAQEKSQDDRRLAREALLRKLAHRQELALPRLAADVEPRPAVVAQTEGAR